MAVTPTPGGFGVHGELSIGGQSRSYDVDVQVSEDGAGWTVTSRASVTQTDHDVAPYSAMLGALRLRDRVDVVFDAVVPRPPT